MQIRGQISSGELSGRLPSIKALAKSLGTSPVTMRSALKALEQDGLLDIVQGNGTFVASSGVDRKKPKRNIPSWQTDSNDRQETTTEAPLTTEDIIAGLSLFVWTEQRRTQITYRENPKPEALNRMAVLAGKARVLEILAGVSKEAPNDPDLKIGVIHLFHNEVQTIRQYPTLGDALVIATK